MKYKSVIVTFLLFTLCSQSLFGWGVWGHKHINKAAVFALPPGMFYFYYNHIDYLTEEAIVPDIRKYTLKDDSEFPKHYIYLEAFDEPESKGFAPYDEKFLRKNGTLPWSITDIMDKLSLAFKKRSKSEILFLSATLGHYLADAHMPLHTTANTDGQLTGQNGLHAFFEAEIPERFGETYSLHTAGAIHIEDVGKDTWRIIRNSHLLVDSVLLVDRSLHAIFSNDKKFSMEADGKTIKRNKYNQTIHTKEYAWEYQQASHGLIERQIRSSVSDLANYWYTAWVNAGSPDLSDLDEASLSAQNKENAQQEMNTWKQGKLLPMLLEREYE